jgi:hypothetical protein
MSKRCVPSKPHESDSVGGEKHVDWQHFDNSQYEGPCSGGQHDTNAGVVESAQDWYDGGAPEHPGKD